MGFIDNVPVVVGVIFPVYLLSPINNKAHWQIATDPKTRMALLIHCRKHDTKNMIFYMAPCFFTLPLEFVYVPANTKVIHKVCGDNQDIMGMAYLHKLPWLISPLITKQPRNVSHTPKPIPRRKAFVPTQQPLFP